MNRIPIFVQVIKKTKKHLVKENTIKISNKSLQTLNLCRNVFG